MVAAIDNGANLVEDLIGSTEPAHLAPFAGRS